MVVKRSCSFCAREIEPGTGMMFIKRDGTVFNFCTSSCRKQQLNLGRVGHRFKWTRAHELKRAADRSSAQRGSSATPGTKPGRTRPGRRNAPVASPAIPVAAPAAEPAPAPTEPAPASSEPAAPAPAAKPRRAPRKKVDAPKGE